MKRLEFVVNIFLSEIVFLKREVASCVFNKAKQFNTMLAATSTTRTRRTLYESGS